MRTFSLTPQDIHKEWFVVDAEGKTLGRLATKVANILQGKHKPTFTPHIDMGDFVVIVNVEKVVLTGNKMTQKLYKHHSNFPGGLKEVPAKAMLARFPERIIETAVKGMLPNNKLRGPRLQKLKLVVGPTHPHEGQKPQPLEV